MLLGLLGGALQLSRFVDPEYLLDDAFITYRVARNLVEAGVPTFDLAFPAVESSTTTSWMVLVALGLELFPGLSPAVPARVLGALCYLGTLLVLMNLAARRARAHGARPEVAALGTAVSLGALGWLAFHALAGMETALFGLLFSLALSRLEALHGAPASRHAWVAGVWLGLLATTRPEGVLVALLAVGLCVVRGDVRRFAVKVAVPAFTAIALLEAWRWVTYHALVPNTFHAHPPSVMWGLRYARRFLLYSVGGLGLLALWPAAKRDGFSRGLLALTGLLLAGIVWSGGDWMPGFRRLTLVALALAVVAGVGLALAVGRWRYAVVVGLLSSVVGNVVLWNSGRESSRFATSTTEQLGAVLQAAGVKQVAFSDIGAFGWFFRGSIFDLYGLTDARIAAAPGGYGVKQWDEAYFLERAPDVVLLRSMADALEPAGGVQAAVVRNERPLAQHLAKSTTYRLRARVPYGEEGWRVLVFAREGVALPGALGGAAAQ